jgi:hypothetical protein
VSVNSALAATMKLEEARRQARKDLGLADRGQLSDVNEKKVAARAAELMKVRTGLLAHTIWYDLCPDRRLCPLPGAPDYTQDNQS